MVYDCFVFDNNLICDINKCLSWYESRNKYILTKINIINKNSWKWNADKLFFTLYIKYSNLLQFLISILNITINNTFAIFALVH